MASQLRMLRLLALAPFLWVACGKAPTGSEPTFEFLVPTVPGRFLQDFEVTVEPPEIARAKVEEKVKGDGTKETVIQVFCRKTGEGEVKVKYTIIFTLNGKEYKTTQTLKKKFKCHAQGDGGLVN